MSQVVDEGKSRGAVTQLVGTSLLKTVNRNAIANLIKLKLDKRDPGSQVENSEIFKVHKAVRKVMNIFWC